MRDASSRWRLQSTWSVGLSPTNPSSPAARRWILNIPWRLDTRTTKTVAPTVRTATGPRPRFRWSRLSSTSFRSGVLMRRSTTTPASPPTNVNSNWIIAPSSLPSPATTTGSRRNCSSGGRGSGWWDPEEVKSTACMLVAGSKAWRVQAKANYVMTRGISTLVPTSDVFLRPKCGVLPFVPGLKAVRFFTKSEHAAWGTAPLTSLSTTPALTRRWSLFVRILFTFEWVAN